MHLQEQEQEQHAEHDAQHRHGHGEEEAREEGGPHVLLQHALHPDLQAHAAGQVEEEAEEEDDGSHMELALAAPSRSGSFGSLGSLGLVARAGSFSLPRAGSFTLMEGADPLKLPHSGTLSLLHSDDGFGLAPLGFGDGCAGWPLRSGREGGGSSLAGWPGGPSGVLSRSSSFSRGGAHVDRHVDRHVLYAQPDMFPFLDADH